MTVRNAPPCRQDAARQMGRTSFLCGRGRLKDSEETAIAGLEEVAINMTTNFRSLENEVEQRRAWWDEGLTTEYCA